MVRLLAKLQYVPQLALNSNLVSAHLEMYPQQFATTAPTIRFLEFITVIPITATISRFESSVNSGISSARFLFSPVAIAGIKAGVHC